MLMLLRTFSLLKMTTMLSSSFANAFGLCNLIGSGRTMDYVEHRGHFELQVQAED